MGTIQKILLELTGAMNASIAQMKVTEGKINLFQSRATSSSSTQTEIVDPP